jgi:hypothetical protein
MHGMSRKLLLAAPLIGLACRAGLPDGSLRLEGPPPTCEVGEGLEVTGEEIGVQSDPLRGIHVEDGAVVASYSGGWAETKLVTLRFPARSRVLVEADYFTDYGDFAGVVLPDESHVHTHEDGVCLDIRVFRGPENRTERWRCRVRMPAGLRADER